MELTVSREGEILVAMNAITSKSRMVPVSTRLTVFFGAKMQQFGWLFFGFGMIFAFVFAGSADITSITKFRGELQRTQGAITSVEKSGFSEGNRRKHGKDEGKPVMEYRYEFSHEEKVFTGVSFSKSQVYPVGQNIQIEFPVGKPEVSRITGMRSAPFGPSVLFVLLFPAVGLCFVLPGLVAGWKTHGLLVNGSFARARLIAKLKTDVQVDSYFVYKLTFQYEDARGVSHQVQTKTHRPAKLEDDAEERLIYDPTRPTQAVFVDALPGAPNISEKGVVSPVGFGSVLARILPPLAATTVITLGTILKMAF